MLFKGDRLWLYPLCYHVRHELVRHLLEHLLRKLLRSILNVFLELNELHDVAQSSLPP